MHDMARMGRPPKITPPEHLERLRELAVEIREVEQQLADLRGERDAVILAAVEAGGSLQAVGDAAGIANQRVSAIVNR